MPSTARKILQRLQGLVWGDGVKDSSVYFEGHTLVVDLVGRDANVAALEVRALNPRTNAPTTVFKVNKNGLVTIADGELSVQSSITSTGGRLAMTALYPYIFFNDNAKGINVQAGGPRPGGDLLAESTLTFPDACRGLAVDESGFILGFSNGNGTPVIGNGLKWYDQYGLVTDCGYPMNAPVVNTVKTGDGTANAPGVQVGQTDMGLRRIAANVLGFVCGAVDVLRVDSSARLKLGGSASRATTDGSNFLAIFNGTAPVGTLTNGVSLYAQAGKLWAMDAAGNATQLTP